MAVKPITPKDVVATIIKPDAVIEAFNELIQKYWDGSHATFKQKEVVMLISEKLGNVGTDIIFANHYLDIEYIYKAAGWKVKYDGPAYNEDYPAMFTFSKV